MLKIDFYSPVNRKTEPGMGHIFIILPRGRKTILVYTVSPKPARTIDWGSISKSNQPTKIPNKQIEYAPGRARFKIPAQEIESQ